MKKLIVLLVLGIIFAMGLSPPEKILPDSGSATFITELVSIDDYNFQEMNVVFQPGLVLLDCQEMIQIIIQDAIYPGPAPQRENRWSTNSKESYTIVSEGLYRLEIGEIDATRRFRET